MLPVIALIGRPNVGKSTLFNQLTRSRDAIVADFPGLTRDRKYGRTKKSDLDAIVIDTGGLDGTEDGIDKKMLEQTYLAIDEADVVLFVVDAREGITVADETIAHHLRVENKSIILVVNKTDGLDEYSYVSDFYTLGFGDPFPVAASHNRGITSLVDNQIIPILMEKGFSFEEEQEDDTTKHKIKFALVGKPNVGKSTLTNYLLGDNQVVVYDEPGTTRDSLYFNLIKNKKEYVLIDTAGIRRRKSVKEVVEKFSIVKTLNSIDESHVVLMIIDASIGLTDQDLSLLGYIINSGRAVVIAINKWDTVSIKQQKALKDELLHRLGFVDFARIIYMSALKGTGMQKLFHYINEAYDCANKKITTSMLTRVIQMAQENHSPPMVNGRRIKLKYAHVGGYNPPTIVIHGNQLESLPQSYKIYLNHYFRKSFQIIGSPIRLIFQSSKNPYENKKKKYQRKM